MTQQFPDLPDAPHAVPTTQVSPVDRFQLLSAYLDNQVTPQERRQVQAWIDTDFQFKRAYLNLLRLQQAIAQLPGPPPSISATALSQRVLAQIDRENRCQRRWYWGGITVAVMLAMIAPFGWDPLKTLIPTPHQAWVNSPEPLMIALNQPLFEVPMQTH